MRFDTAAKVAALERTGMRSLVDDLGCGHVEAWAGAARRRDEPDKSLMRVRMLDERRKLAGMWDWGNTVVTVVVVFAAVVDADDAAAAAQNLH